MMQSTGICGPQLSLPWQSVRLHILTTTFARALFPFNPDFDEEIWLHLGFLKGHRVWYLEGIQRQVPTATPMPFANGVGRADSRPLMPTSSMFPRSRVDITVLWAP